jgi:hypothetical protein
MGGRRVWDGVGALAGLVGDRCLGLVGGGVWGFGVDRIVG